MGYVHEPSKQRAIKAADFLREHLKIDEGNQPEVGLVLGTGWGDVLEFDAERRVSFEDIPGFGKLEELEGHAREVVCGTISGKNFVALRGRVHLNERPADPGLHSDVRLQLEMLVHLGVKKFIITCAVGSLVPSVKVGDVIFPDGFVTLFAPEMPLFAGEFCSPEDAIDQDLRMAVLNNEAYKSPLRLGSGGHVMVRGPFFEGRKYDKKLLASRVATIVSGMIMESTGAIVVGMSVLPEACIAALYEAKVLPVAFVTNTASEEHSHEENQRRAREKAAHLGALLGKIVERM